MQAQRKLENFLSIEAITSEKVERSPLQTPPLLPHIDTSYWVVELGLQGQPLALDCRLDNHKVYFILSRSA
jgi:hypothetical protein